MTPIPTQALRCRGIENRSGKRMQPAEDKSVYLLKRIFAIRAADAPLPRRGYVRQSIEDAPDLTAAKVRAAGEGQFALNSRCAQPVMPSNDRGESFPREHCGRQTALSEHVHRPQCRPVGLVTKNENHSGANLAFLYLAPTTGHRDSSQVAAQL